MNGLSKFLIEGILGESKPPIALFGGGFKPPTKGHLDVVLQGLKSTPEVNHIKILVGQGVRDGVTQGESIEVWKRYQKFIPIESEVIPVTSPLGFYKDYLREHPEDKVYIFIGAREDNEGDLKDVAQRSKFIKRYSDNVIPTLVSTPGGVSGTLSRKYLNTDPFRFKKTLPHQLSDEEKEEIYQILISPKVPPLNEVQSPPIRAELLSKYGEYIDKFFLFPSDDGESIELNLLKIKPEYKGQGWATKILNDLTEYAQSNNIILTLTPSDTFGADTNRLEKFYNRFGFTSNKDREIEDTMIRRIDEIFNDPFGLIHTINEIAGQTFDFTTHIDSLTKYMVDKGMNVEPLPKTTFVNDDDENANDFMGKTAFYDPNQREIVLYTLNRHPKDVMRSFAHEMIHHIQNLEDRLGNITTTDTREDDNLTQIEKEAYTDGNLTFRKWTETINEAVDYEDLLSQTEKEALDIVDKNWDNFDGEECNKGFCDIFAYKLQKLLPDSKLMHTEESNEGYGHVWVEYKGKHYDSETPKGVDDWKELPWMIEFNKTNNRYPSDVDVLQEILNEITSQEMRYWAFHGDIFSQLRKFGEEKYNEFIKNAKGERKIAVEYFWDLLKKGELSERLASQENIHKFNCNCG